MKSTLSDLVSCTSQKHWFTGNSDVSVCLIRKISEKAESKRAYLSAIYDLADTNERVNL